MWLEHRGQQAFRMQQAAPTVSQPLYHPPQAVLDRMDGMKQRAAAPAMPASNATSAEPVATAAAAGVGLGEQSPPTSAPNSPSVQQLCDQFSWLLQAGGAGLLEVQQELAVVQQADAAAQRMEVAATRAALDGLEAAAQAAERAASLQLAAAEPPATQPPGELDSRPPAAEGSGPDQADAVPATAQLAQQEQRVPNSALPAAAEQAGQAASPGPHPPSADAAAALPSCAVGSEAAPAADAQQAEELPPAERPQAPADVAGPPAGANAAPTSASVCLAAEPAAGWPVQWQPPVAPGVTLLLPPPAAAQPHWAVPAVSSCAWQPAAAVPLLAPQLGAPLCWGQPREGPQQAQQEASMGPQQAQQEAAVEWEPPFSVASDEELPDSPSSSGCASPATAPSSRTDCGTGEGLHSVELRTAASAGGGAGTWQEEAQQEQAVLDELAALSIRQYQQVGPRSLGLRMICACAQWRSPLLLEGVPLTTSPVV